VLQPDDAYALYSRAWNEPEQTRALLEQCWADDGIYADDETPDGVVGREALAELILSTHATLPGFRVWETSPTRMLAGRLCVTWTQAGGDPPEGFSGSDVIELAADGRIARVTGVLGPA
jgi:hypothetical protein